MKKLLQKLFLVAAMCMVACTQNMIEESMGSLSQGTILYATAPSGEIETKVEFTDNDAQGIALSWEVDDEFSLYLGDDLIATYSCTDAALGEFSPIDPTVALVSGTEYTAKYNEFASLDEQDGDQINNLDAACQMVATFTYGQDEPIVFEHTMAIMTFKFASDERPAKLVFDNCQNSYVVSYSAIESVNDLYTSHIMIEPCEATERTLCFSLLNSEGTAYDIRTVSTSKAYEAGYRYTAPVNDLPTVSWSGSGVEDDPYMIESAEVLRQLATYVNAGTSFANTYFEMSDDIDLSDYACWEPIGSYELSAPFCGVFNGGGHTITGLSIDSTLSNRGLFGYVVGGIIQNIIIKEPSIVGAGYTGAIAGCIKSSSVVTSCGVEGGSVYGSGSYMGGVVGRVEYSTVTACYNTSSVSGSNYGVGGVTGGASSSYITACYNHGSIYGASSYVGGVAAFAYSSTLTSCYNTGSVEGSDSSLYLGGVTGDVTTGSIITDCYYIANIVYSYGTRLFTLDALNEMVSTLNSAAGSDYFTVNSDNILPSLLDEQIEYYNEGYVEHMEISTLDDLKAFRDVVKNDNPLQPKTVTLTADIDLGGVEWEPVGIYATVSTPFVGVFDGGGHTISGLSTSDSTLSDQGLFGYVVGGTIKNLIIKEPSIVGAGYTGAVAGCITSGSTITACGVEGGSVYGSSNYIGGVVGRVEYSTVAACYNTSYVTGSYYVGGVAGSLLSSNITASYNTGSVEGDSYVSSIIGYASSTSSLAACYCIAEVEYIYGTTVSTLAALNEVIPTMNSAAGSDYFTVNSGNILPSLFDEQIEYTDFEYDTTEHIEISTLDELKAFRDVVNNDNSLQPKTVTLTADIDLGGVEWEPIGIYATVSTPFVGVFDGGGHTISGLSIDSTLSDRGLFGYVVGGTIKNLIIKEPSIVGAGYTGAVAGCTTSGSIITACGVEGGSVYGSGSYIGGVVGRVEYSLVTACYNTSSVEGSSSVGGVVGYSYSSLTACYNTGSVEGSGDFVGGVVGYALSSSLTDSYYLPYADLTYTNTADGTADENLVSTMTSSEFPAVLNTAAGEEYFEFDTYNYNGGYPILCSIDYLSASL